MVFKRKKRSAGFGEPQTKSGLFESAADKTPPGSNPDLNQRSNSGADQEALKTPSSPGVVAEPPTRDAIFSVPPVIDKKEPPTGWIAVLSGPEKGRVIPLGYGVTDLKLGEPITSQSATSESETSESETSHSVTYDPAQTLHTLKRGGEAHALQDRERLELGGVHVIFIPLCADGFDWRTS